MDVRRMLFAALMLAIPILVGAKGGGGGGQSSGSGSKGSPSSSGSGSKGSPSSSGSGSKGSPSSSGSGSKGNPSSSGKGSTGSGSSSSTTIYDSTDVCYNSSGQIINCPMNKKAGIIVAIVISSLVGPLLCCYLTYACRRRIFRGRSRDGDKGLGVSTLRPKAQDRYQKLEDQHPDLDDVPVKYETSSYQTPSPPQKIEESSRKSEESHLPYEGLPAQHEYPKPSEEMPSTGYDQPRTTYKMPPGPYDYSISKDAIPALQTRPLPAPYAMPLGRYDHPPSHYQTPSKFEKYSSPPAEPLAMPLPSMPTAISTPYENEKPTSTSTWVPPKSW